MPWQIRLAYHHSLALVADCTASVLGDAVELREVLVNLRQWNPAFRQDLASTYMNRGVVYAFNNSLTEAINDFSLAINIVCELRETLTLLGFWHRGIRNGYIMMLRNRAHAYKQSGQPELASADFSAAAEVEAIEGP